MFKDKQVLLNKFREHFCTPCTQANTCCDCLLQEAWRAVENASQQSFAPDVCDARLENHEWVRRDGIEICFHCKRPRR